MFKGLAGGFKGLGLKGSGCWGFDKDFGFKVSETFRGDVVFCSSGKQTEKRMDKQMNIGGVEDAAV